MKSATMPFFARLAAGLLAFTALPAAVCLPTAAFAQKTQVEPGAVLKNLSIGVGKSVMIDLPRDATEIFIGDPTVANAVVRSPRKLFLLALANGQTTIYAMDAAGKQIAVIDVSAGRNIEQLAEILKAALPNSALTVRTVNDTVILTGSVDNANDAQQATDIADGFTGGGQLSEKNGVTTRTAKGKVINSITIRGRDQVMVKVTIAEIQRNILKTLGVTSSTASGSWGSFATANTPTLNGGQGLGANILKLGSTSLGATLEAFERSGVGRILAEPNVTAVSGEAAKFTAGGTIPVPAGTSCSTGANNQNICIAAFEYKPYGVTLNMTPVVQSEGRIQLRIATEVTEVDNQQTFTYGNSTVPGFRTRKHETTVELPSGGSIASAGLISVRSAASINGTPGLMNLPILGSLFRSRDFLRNETEMVIIVTPYIVKPVGPKDLMRPTDNFADATDPQAVLLGRVNRLYSTTSNPQMIGHFKGKVGFIND